ncbi:MFS transporter [Microbacterium protaetiae]|uniref:MFS transporter n=1 Tax=Microbacterium protaetiae TaxID=2509458 RepID=A0A4P6E9T7_9MICO|nr:MFS transporter [Microbacterium protaetiae]QAY58704.1 MFS transporter [Microbacterium protaetiae]
MTSDMRLSLRHNRPFRALWTSSVGESLADDVSRSVLPLVAASTLGAGSSAIGLLQALSMAAFLLLGIPAGAVVERARIRRVMLSTTGVRAVAVTTIPIAAFCGVLSMWQLFCAVAVIGVADVFFSAASSAALPRHVAAPDLGQAYSSLRATQAATSIAGPGIGSVIIRMSSPAVAVFSASAGYLLSALALSRYPDDQPFPTESPERQRRSLWRDAADGLSYAARHRVLRPLFLGNAFWNSASAMANAVLVVFALQEAGLRAGDFALVTVCEAAAAFAGATLATSLSRALGIGRAKTVAMTANTLVLAAYPVVPSLFGSSFLWIAALGSLSTFAAMIYSLSAAGTVAQVTPPGLHARVMSCARFAALGPMPVASIVGGTVGDIAGLSAALMLAAVLSAMSLAVFMTNPQRRWKAMPTAEELISAGYLPREPS